MFVLPTEHFDETRRVEKRKNRFPPLVSEMFSLFIYVSPKVRRRSPRKHLSGATDFKNVLVFKKLLFASNSINNAILMTCHLELRLNELEEAFNINMKHV